MTLRFELRSATKELHRQLDSHRALSPLTSPDITLAQYQCALQAMYPLFAGTEDRIAEYVENHSLPIDFTIWRRAPELLHDLEYYELPAADGIWAGPEIASDGALVGCFYVLAGSAIGGRAIAKHVNQVLGVTPETGGRFFYGYGTEFSALWHSFWEFAGAHCPDDQTESAVAGATTLFQSYIALLDDNLWRRV